MKKLIVLGFFAGAFLLATHAQAETWVEAKRRTTDREWKQYSTTTLSDLDRFKKALPVTLNAYGGRADRKNRATGFFYTAKVDGRWIMVDPDGCDWYQVACNSVRPNRTQQGQAALAKRFGTREEWAKQTVDQLRQYGFNMLGNWSDTAIFRAKKPIPYAKTSSFMASFGRKLNVTYQASGHTGYAGNAIPVFHPDFPEFCRLYAKETLTETRDDPWLVGHFSDNELPFQDDSLKRFMALPADNVNRRAASKWLREKGVDPKARTFSKELQEEFLGFLAETYFKEVSQAIREVDPNHLYLGCRFHGSDRRHKALWEAAGKYVDVVSMNWYGVWTPDMKTMDNWTSWSKRPFIITEWYAKGMDSGMSNVSGAGWTVKTQEDRGKFYQNFTLALTRHPSCVGWHWFKYMDNDPTNTEADASNRDSNKGIVSYLYEPYPNLIRYMKELNTQVYLLVDREDLTP